MIVGEKSRFFIFPIVIDDGDGTDVLIMSPSP